MTKAQEILKYSDPKEVYRRAAKYMGKRATISLSTRRDKKYMITTPNGRIVHFGQMGYQDFTFTHNKTKRKNYLRRSAKIRGNWAKNKYSANNLSRKLLW